MAERDVRWGILGTGNIAGNFAEDIPKSSGARAVAVGSRDAVRAAAFASRHGIPSSHGSYEELVSDPDIDIVFVASPHIFHYEHAMLALRHNKAVVVEKPFAMTAWQAESLIDEARQRNLLLMEAMWTLCNPLVIDLMERVARGDIGKPRAFIANIGPMGVPVLPGLGLRIENPALGASFLLECLVYPLALLAALAPALAKAETVSAVSTFTDQQVDDYSAIILKTADGEASSISGGLAFGSLGRAASRAQLIGSHGWLEINDDVTNPGRALVCTRAGIETIENEAMKRRYAWEIEEASRTFREGRTESQRVPLSRTLDVMHLLDRARASAGIEIRSLT